MTYVKGFRVDIHKRFWSKVAKRESDKCWEWTRAKNIHGYGKFNLNGKAVGSHTVAWTLVNGPIPQGKYILHKCDNRGCNNPDHLYAGTQSQNLLDRAYRNPTKQGGPHR